MTKANVLKKFFKKFFNIDAEGNSSISVLTNVVQNNDSLPGGGGGADIMVVHGQIWYDVETGAMTEESEVDATSIEIEEAYESGKPVFLLCSYWDNNMQMSLMNILNHKAIFYNPQLAMSNLAVEIDEDGSVNAYSIE